MKAKRNPALDIRDALTGGAAPSPRLLRLREAAEFSRCSADWLRRRIKAGDLPAYRTAPGRAGHLLVTEADILALLRTNGTA